MSTLTLCNPMGPGWFLLFQQCERIPGGRSGSEGDRNPLLRFLSNADIEALKERPDLLNTLQQREDDDIVELVVNMITRGFM